MADIRLPKKLTPIDVTKRDFTRDIEHTPDFLNVKSFKYRGTKSVTDQIQYGKLDEIQETYVARKVNKIRDETKIELCISIGCKQ